MIFLRFAFELNLHKKISEHYNSSKAAIASESFFTP